MKVPYAMVAAVNNHRRHGQMMLALQYGFPRLQQQPMDNTKTLTIACYGPSLADTYKEMKPPILSMSAATKWLAERGVIPDYHCDMDPRANKVADFTPIVPGVHYIMASVCHPDVWKCLFGQRVTLFHVYSSQDTYDWVAELDPGQFVLRGGSTIGLTALHLGGVMGYRHFEIHGMDGSFKDLTRSARHAGPHTGHKQNKDGITWDAGGKTYATSKIMANAVAETLNSVEHFPMFCVFHGDGLTQALIREKNFKNACCADETEKARKIRNATAHILDALVVDPAKGVTPTIASWDVLCGPLQPEWKEELDNIRQTNESRRQGADYNTGSITLEQMMQLRGICERQKPKTVVEIGTFIGNSAMAMRADNIYTCDRSNDCFPSTETIHTFPKQDSTAMLTKLVDENQKADMFFFDGRIQPQDVPLILRLSHPKTIYAFDDFNGMEKGVINAKLMASMLPPTWMLLEPDPRLKEKSTLAALAPMELFKAEVQ